MNRQKQPPNKASMGILQMLRTYQQRTRSILPHAEELADELTMAMIQAIQTAIKSFHLSILNTLEQAKDGMTDDEISAADRVIMKVAEIGNPPIPDNGDGTDPNE